MGGRGLAKMAHDVARLSVCRSEEWSVLFFAPARAAEWHVCEFNLQNFAKAAYGATCGGMRESSDLLSRALARAVEWQSVANMDAP